MSSSVSDQSVADVSLSRPRSATPALLLWLLWAVLLSTGLYAATFGPAHWSSVGRLGSSVVLLLAGWTWCVLCGSTRASTYAFLIALGMSLGCLGDFFMAGKLQHLIQLPKAELGGMAAFGLGHIVYICGCANARRVAGLTSAAAMWASIVLWQLLAVVGWYFVVFTATKEGIAPLVWPALPYSMLLAGTAGMATGLAVQDRRFSLLAVGAALFLISDLVLAWGMFHDRMPHQTLAVWIPYGGGQMLIVYAITMARSALLTLQNDEV